MMLNSCSWPPLVIIGGEKAGKALPVQRRHPDTALQLLENQTFLQNLGWQKLAQAYTELAFALFLKLREEVFAAQDVEYKVTHSVRTVGELVTELVLSAETYLDRAHNIYID